MLVFTVLIRVSFMVRRITHVCCACASHPGFACASGSHKLPHTARTKESLQEAEILHEVAEEAADLALPVPDGTL